MHCNEILQSGKARVAQPGAEDAPEAWGPPVVAPDETGADTESERELDAPPESAEFEDDGALSTSKQSYGSSDADALVELVDALGTELWCDVDDPTAAYATVPVDGHAENLRITRATFRLWLMQRWWTKTGSVIGSQPLSAAQNTLAGRAILGGKLYPTFVRVGKGDDGALWLDLADADRRAVRVDALGWQLRADAAPKFLRPRGLLPLPAPVRQGSIHHLWRFVNVPTMDQPLVTAALVGALNFDGPHVITVMYGEAGSAKSTTTRMLRSLIDPNAAPLRAEPRDTRDLFIAASNSWWLALDNLSSLSPQLSDNLCRLATGGGFSVRELYTDDNERLFSSMRPILLNGISDFARRQDLLDRAIVVSLPTINQNVRRAERELLGGFQAARPGILGSLLDAVVTGLRNRDKVRLASVPRMADFAEWVVACEPGLNQTPGTFLRAYEANRLEALAAAREAALLVQPLLGLLDRGQGQWEGTATALLGELNHGRGDAERRQAGWPRTPAALGSEMRRIAAALRPLKVEVRFDKIANERRISIRRTKRRTDFLHKLGERYVAEQERAERDSHRRQSLAADGQHAALPSRDADG